MPSGADNIVGGTVFTPTLAGNPTVFYCNNCTGVVGAASDAPLRVAAGQYRIFLNGSYNNTMISIIKRATTAAGGLLHVTVLPSAPLGDRTAFDIFIRTNAGVADDTASFVECTISRLPLP